MLGRRRRERRKSRIDSSRVENLRLKLEDGPFAKGTMAMRERVAEAHGNTVGYLVGIEGLVSFGW